MWFHLEPSSPIPIYAQIAEQVKRAVAGGILLPGDQLPSVRELAMKLRINPNTVARAYLELEREGVVATQRGRGTFVADGIRALPEVEREREVKGDIERALVKARDYGIKGEKVRALFAGAMRRLFVKSAKQPSKPPRSEE
ncbi:MAG TPA: GntR family transcriptional regulator [Firmicutes bacterium]|nr:GntR family transcriptional regulator [Bacillota bacterium]